MRYDTKIREEELKHKVAADWFAAYDCTRAIGNIDFAVEMPATELALGYASEPALWAEAKAGARKDIAESFVQLILTIGRARLADELPPLFLGAFDAEKIAFIPYNAVLDVLGTNDFNWNVTPSDHESKEFKLLYALASDTIAREKMLFDFERDATELERFIRVNFRRGREDVSKLCINKNNFTHIYRKWREAVYPFIDAPWEMLKKNYGIYDRDFYLAEINVDDKDTPDIADDTPAADFYITFRGTETQPYWMKRKDASGLPVVLPFGFKPGGLEAYAEFWRRYKRPPKKDYWSFIVKRLDLLVPQDVRERKGSFFTPRIWVEKSQQYLAKALGENWQDEYFVWDCAGGTGNMEVGLTNKYNVFVSTLDQQDVDVIHQTFGEKGAKTLLDSHVFQFDFLNDDFSKVPAALREIIVDPEKRKKLVIYINPPYAEVSTIGGGKKAVNQSMVHDKYADLLGTAGRELYTQFLIRIAKEIDGCIIGQFSTLKTLQGGAFAKFRAAFRGTLKSLFVVPAATFDNVKGEFPIGFFVWDMSVKSEFHEIDADVFDKEGKSLGTKLVSGYAGCELMTDWVAQEIPLKPTGEPIGFLAKTNSNDFQNNNIICILNKREQLPNPRGRWIDAESLFISAVYYAVRKSLDATWLNDRDQFLKPTDQWKNDLEFQSDCLVFMLFHGQNRISTQFGPNHWIPFTEAEVGAHDRFASHFMTDFIAGKAAHAGELVAPRPAVDDGTIFNVGRGATDAPCGAPGGRALPCGAQQEGDHHRSTSNLQPQPLAFSPTAKSVLAAGRELWRYYHSQPDANPNASYYDIRAHFQGRKPNGTMNATSADETYNAHLDTLKKAMKQLAMQIEPKVYAYGFLKR